MVKDNIKAARRYAGLSPRIAQALEFAARGGLEGLGAGRHDIDGDNLYVTIQCNPLKDWAEGKWEAHRAYADIQLVLRGREVIGYQDIAALAPQIGYDPEHDIEFFAEGDGARVEMREGDFMVMFPEDAHRPNLLAEGMSGGESIELAVFKVRL